MRHTKIICTVGPATESAEMLRKLVQAGTDVFRLNFSHGTVSEHQSPSAASGSSRRRPENPSPSFKIYPVPKSGLAFSKMDRSSFMPEIVSASQPRTFPGIMNTLRSAMPNFLRKSGQVKAFYLPMGLWSSRSNQSAHPRSFAESFSVESLPVTKAST